MKILARKKKTEGSSGGNAPWLNTFADLMNLLLCFFVLLFAYSDVNEEKFQELSISMANSIGIFEAGSSSIGKGQLISSGMSQLNDLDKLFKSMGKSTNGNSDPNDSVNSGSEVKGEEGSENILEGKDGTEGDKSIDGEQNSDSNGGSDSNQTASEDKNIELEDAIDKLQEEKAKLTSDMYDQVSDLRDQYNLSGETELNIDPEYQYVQLELKGSVLFDSGSAQIKKEAEPILNKIGKLLKRFDGNELEIVGHTDNVPMTSGEFKNNNWLSAARALNAAQFLIDNCDMDPTTLKYSGRGEYEPISSNATSDGRARNRRIEIKIYNKYSGR